MAQIELNLEAALAARDRGVQKTTSKNGTFIETMRGVARLICHRQRTVTADDLKEWAAQNDIQPTHYNAFGTPADNMRDKEAKGRGTGAITHCKRGHEFTPENTYIAKGGFRHCRTCHNLRERERRRKQC